MGIGKNYHHIHTGFIQVKEAHFHNSAKSMMRKRVSNYTVNLIKYDINIRDVFIDICYKKQEFFEVIKEVLLQWFYLYFSISTSPIYQMFQG